MKLLGLLGTRGLELLLFHAILENSSTNYRVQSCSNTWKDGTLEGVLLGQTRGLSVVEPGETVNEKFFQFFK